MNIRNWICTTVRKRMMVVWVISHEHYISSNLQVNNGFQKSDRHSHDRVARNCSLHTLNPSDVLYWTEASVLSSCRRSATSTGLQSAQPGTSTSWWIPWLSTTCPSTSSESSKSPMPGWVITVCDLYALCCIMVIYVIKDNNNNNKKKTLLFIQDGQSRTVRQFQFTDWPEQGVPKSGEGFIDFIGQVHKTKEQFGQDGPITVHCR